MSAARIRIGTVESEFLQGLRQLAGLTATTCVDTRWGAGDADLFRGYAAELVALAPDVILASGTAP
jgi:hypothetical protein